MMSEEWQSYVKDTRKICKYGLSCYQKNAEHHKTYKHPPTKNKLKTHGRRNKKLSPYSRDVKDNNKDNSQADRATGSQNISFNESATVSKTSSLEIEGTNNKNDQQAQVNENFVSSIRKILLNPSYHISTTNQEKYKELFLVEMPEDFFQFYECLAKEDEPVDKILANVNLELIGPYDLLMGKLPILENKEIYLVHWRFFYDPPEFQSVLKTKGKSQFHIGYFRDDPNAQPEFMASNDPTNGCQLNPVASNIFGAVYLHLKNEKNKSPFTAVSCQKLMERIKSWADQYDHSLEDYNIKKRISQCVTKTFHGAGIMVDYNKKTQLGYRHLVETDANIKKLFTRLEKATSQNEKDKILTELQPVITYANIAVDECDFGTGLEVGIDMFCSGLKELEASALNSLCSAYSLLNRKEFVTIVQVHMNCRRKGSNMSLLSIVEK